jgi:hypothetical protein
MVFWFANAFNLKDKEQINELALSSSYVLLAVSVRDDLQDGKVSSEHAHVCLANIYYEKYVGIFKNIFSSRSIFWYLSSNCLSDWAKYESWIFVFNYRNKINPFSERFLKQSSKYLVATTLPPFAAHKILTKNETEMPKVRKFLLNYWMGWRRVDDIRDWQGDLRVPNFNQSSILYYELNKSNAQKRECKSTREFVTKNGSFASKLISLKMNQLINQ